MNQQCGNCKWWNGLNRSNVDGRYFGFCHEPTIEEEFMINDEGQNCPVYEERKE